MEDSDPVGGCDEDLDLVGPSVDSAPHIGAVTGQPNRVDAAVAHDEDCADRQHAYCNALVHSGSVDEARLAFTDFRHMCPRLTMDHLQTVYRKAFDSEEIAERYISGLREFDWI